MAAFPLLRLSLTTLLLLSTVANVNGNRSVEGIRVGDDAQLKKLVKIMTNEISRLMENIEEQEKSSLRRFEKFEETMQKKMGEKLQTVATRLEEKITESLELQERKFNEKLDLTKRELIEQVEGVKATVDRKLEEAKIEMVNTGINFKSNVTEEIFSLKKVMSTDLRMFTERAEEEGVRAGERIRQFGDNLTTVIRGVDNVLSFAYESQDSRLKMVENFLKKSDVPGQLENLTMKIEGVRSTLREEVPGNRKNHPAPSCHHLYTHNYNMKDGYYWLTSENGPTLTYCYMTKFVDYEASSCKSLKLKYPHLQSGMYWLNLENKTEVYCDMDTDGGGWIKVGSAVVSKESEKDEVVYTKLLSDDISRLAEVKTNRFLLGTTGMRELQTHTSFEEIRFYCHKEWHGRTVHIKTAKNFLGRQAVKYLIGKNLVSPVSCGSYNRFSDDTSYLGNYCDQWVGGKWYMNNMYSSPFYISGHSHLALYPTRIECDDYAVKDKPNFRTVGTWSFYVR